MGSWKARGGLNRRPWRIVTGEIARIEAEPVNLATLGPIAKADDAPVVTRSTLKSKFHHTYSRVLLRAPIAGVRADYDGGGGSRPQHRRYQRQQI